jgi:hypothetical protein
VGSVVADEQGLSAGVTSIESGAPGRIEMARLLTAAPQYVPPGVDASGGGVEMGTL